MSIGFAPSPTVAPKAITAAVIASIAAMFPLALALRGEPRLSALLIAGFYAAVVALSTAGSP